MVVRPRRQFLDKLFDKPDPDTATVRVAAGLDGHGLTQAQGSLSGVNVYNEFQHLIGSSGGGNIGSGGYYDFKVDQHNLQQATFVELLGSDAMALSKSNCITMSSVPEKKQRALTSLLSSRPACTWVDADHTNGIKAGSILIHMPSFSGNHQHSNNASSYCGYPAFRAYRDSDGTGSIFKRSESAPDRRHQKIAADSRLVVSDIPFHSAIDLCKASKSHGPDFVSTSEGVYCDMESREVMPVCRGDVKHNCFNLDHHVNEESRSSVADHSTRKSYSNVVKWDYGF
ncbi:hypothetical protein N7510_011625 [Penicillium lagena]|uniref:uncharacterized protein n=1 Tax=Penicillium lagena TaxID=94218 RepID=UPI0025401830|nr:uncharacterized protein N7510_011625 [Penicillium lagena]KAJ5602091.1 hypothetical protein N7510_011625 [Penicillium lagena]